MPRHLRDVVGMDYIQMISSYAAASHARGVNASCHDTGVMVLGGLCSAFVALRED